MRLQARFHPADATSKTIASPAPWLSETIAYSPRWEATWSTTSSLKEPYWPCLYHLEVTMTCTFSPHQSPDNRNTSMQKLLQPSVVEAHWLSPSSLNMNGATPLSTSSENEEPSNKLCPPRTARPVSHLASVLKVSPRSTRAICKKTKNLRLDSGIPGTCSKLN